MPKKISNKFILAIVAKMLGKQELTNNDGKVELSDEEQEKVRQVYGQTFLDRLLVSDDSESDAASIFDAMVAEGKTKDQTIATLQGTVNELAKAPEPKPAAVAVAQPSAQKSFNVNMSAMHNRIAAQALANPGAVLNAVSDSGIDVTDLNAELGTVMPAGVKLDILSKRIYNGFNDAKYLTRIQTNTDYKATAALMSEVSQQFTPAWTPKGSGKFTPCVIKYRRHKINVEILPADILKSWLLYLYEQGKTQAEMPIVKYLIENHILPKVADDITLAMLGKGRYVEVNASDVHDGADGSAASASMDGYETVLVDGKSDPKCKFNFFKAAKDFRTLTDAELLEYVDSFVDAISPLFAQRLELHCSQEFLTRYKRADFAINGKYTGFENDGKIRFTNFTLIPLDSMYNSPILFATPRENFVMLVDLASAERCINKIAEENYKVKVFGEYSLSVGFRIQEAVYAAVPAGYNPTSSVLNDDTAIGDAWTHGGGEGSSSSGEDSSETA